MKEYAKMREFYGESDWSGYQEGRYKNLVDRFEQHYGKMNMEFFSSPGRTELLGNHTDHERGEVLAAAVNLDMIAAVGDAGDDKISIVSGDEEYRINVNESAMKEGEQGTTSAFIRGCVQRMKEKGYRVGGFRAVLASDVAVGSGLSSSAAFETMILTILSTLYNKGVVTPESISRIGQYAETVYFGKPCGLMDQIACAYGNVVHIDFGNLPDIQVEQVDFEPGKYGYSLCVTNTHGSHADLTEEYAQVPREMKAVAEVFGKRDLCGVTLDELYGNVALIRKKCGDRAFLRAIHCIEENERVRRGVKALKEGRMDEFLSAVEESGNSSFKYLQNVYVAKKPKVQDLSVALALSESFLKGGKGVCRVHGGGFAGTIQTFIRKEYAEGYEKYMDGIFGEGACRELKIRNVGGIHFQKDNQ